MIKLKFILSQHVHNQVTTDCSDNIIIKGYNAMQNWISGDSDMTAPDRSENEIDSIR